MTPSKVEQKLDRVLEILGKMREENAVRDERVQTVEEVSAQTAATLNGNGKAGLKTTVELLRHDVDNATTWLRVVVGIAITQVAIVLMGILTHAIKIGP